MNLLKRKTLFILEDHKVYRNLLTYYLSKASPFIVRKFSKGDDLLKKMHLKPDIVILDYHLDTITEEEEVGYNVLKKIKELNNESHVIMLTKNDQAETIVKCMKAGAYDYVVKNETALLRLENMLNHLYELLIIKNAYLYKSKMASTITKIILLGFGLSILVVYLIQHFNLI